MSAIAQKKAHSRHSPAQPELPLRSRRLEEIARTKKGCFSITPTLILPEPGFNERMDYGDLHGLASDIEANGLQQPLTIRKVEGEETIYLVDGHRRLRAICEILIPEGRWPADPKDESLPAPVDCIPARRFASSLDLLFMQLSSNSGKPLTLVEKSNLYQRILKSDPKMCAAEIARRRGETKQAISDALRLQLACPALRDGIQAGLLAASTALAIVKQAGDSSTEQMALLKTATEAAAKAGRENVMPKDVPGRESSRTPKGPSWKRVKTKKGKALYGVTSKGVECLAQNAVILSGLPDGHHVGIGWSTSRHADGYFVGYHIQSPEEVRLCATPQDGTRCRHLSECAGYLIYTEMHRVFGWGPTDLRRLCDELARCCPEWAETPDASAAVTDGSGNDSDERQGSEAIPSGSDAGGAAGDLPTTDGQLSRAFNLYQIPDAPADPDQSGNYAETDRLVLEDFPAGISRLHLISAMTSQGTGYGYRIDDATGPKAVRLPREDHPTTGSEPITGYLAMLSEALGLMPHGECASETVKAALADAIIRYYEPPSGVEPEEPEVLAYVAEPVAPSKADPGAIQRIKGASSTNRDGSGVGLGNDRGYVDPAKRLKQLNGILEDLGEAADPERRITAELIHSFLLNEASPASVKAHLKGES